MLSVRDGHLCLEGVDLAASPSAYTLEMMHPYNARPRAAAVAVTRDGEARLIRRRETDEELGRTMWSRRARAADPAAAGSAARGGHVRGRNHCARVWANL